jgi:hypothetical protein
LGINGSTGLEKLYGRGKEYRLAGSAKPHRESPDAIFRTQWPVIGSLSDFRAFLRPVDCGIYLKYHLALEVLFAGRGKGLKRVTRSAARGGAVINRAIYGPACTGSLPGDHRTRSIGIAKEERNGN